jgi:DNA excision repair protein ERCC-3
VPAHPPISIQRSGALILDTSGDTDGSVEDVIRQFAELTSAAGNLHTYRITNLSLWGAAASGLDSGTLLSVIDRYSAAPAPATLLNQVQGFFSRYGNLWIESHYHAEAALKASDAMLLQDAAQILSREVSNGTIVLRDDERSWAKALLARNGMPVCDPGLESTPTAVPMELSETVELRDYQRHARDRFLQHSDDGGVIILPCGAGKTVVGVAIAAALSSSTLILTPNRTIGEQWAEHLCFMTTLTADDIELFPSQPGERAVSILTYQALTTQANGTSQRLSDAMEVPWGLVIYDEVHSLPADVFRQSAILRSKRRLGLTATLVREDGREHEVYSLVGPPIWRSRWRELERDGWISPVECVELRVRVDDASGQPDRGFLGKVRTVERLLDRHRNDRVLIAAHRLREVEVLSQRLGIPSVVGKTSQAQRRRLFEQFRSGEIRQLVVSAVANVGVDLPDANVLIQVSGTFGSRLEEAQRLGRLLRPKSNAKPARFYSMVLPVTREREFAERRQRFLVDQGYHYQIVNVRG